MKWEFEPGHTAAEFKVRHMMVTWVRGCFKNIKGSLEFDPEQPAGGSVELSIPANTLWSGDKARDGHLLTPDFLDAEKHPTITFKSTKVEHTGKNEYKVFGDLTLRGVTKNVLLRVQYLGQWQTPFWVGDKDEGPIPRAGFVATTIINRHDFGVSWNGSMDKGGIVVGNDVHITLDVEALGKK